MNQIRKRKENRDDLLRSLSFEKCDKELSQNLAERYMIEHALEG